MVLGLGLEVLGLGFEILGLGFEVSGSKFRRFQVALFIAKQI